MKMNQIIQLLLRHALTAAGTVMVTSGYVDAEQAQAVSGAIMTIVGIAWSVFDKKGR